MANIHSQKKRILRAERERLENRRYTSTIRTFFRRLEAAVTAGDAETAAAEHRTLVQTIDKAIKRGALHRNTGARKKSRAERLLRGDRRPERGHAVGSALAACAAPQHHRGKRTGAARPWRSSSAGVSYAEGCWIVGLLAHNPAPC